MVDELSQEQVPTHVNEGGTKEYVFTCGRYQVVNGPGEQRM